MRVQAILISSLLFASQAWAGGNGGDLYAACTSDAGTMADQSCDSYLNGFANGIIADQVALRGNSPICIPAFTTTRQLRELFIDAITQHPDVKTIGAGAVLGTVLMRAYPCKMTN
jgi:hypothetical protein